MGDGETVENWGAYLRRMTDRPSWSVARLARESNIHRGTIFKWIAGQGGVTVASVRAIAEALGDDPADALRAAGAVADNATVDTELELVRTDPDLDPDMKVRIVNLILERRQRERERGLVETQQLIELMKQRA